MIMQLVMSQHARLMHAALDREFAVGEAILKQHIRCVRLLVWNHHHHSPGHRLGLWISADATGMSCTSSVFQPHMCNWTREPTQKNYMTSIDTT